MIIPCQYVLTKFFSESNQFTIAVFKAKPNCFPDDFLSDEQKDKKYILFSAKGIGIPTQKNYNFELEGDLKLDNKYGLSLDVSNYNLIPPEDTEGIRQYLIDFIDGVGKKTADAIVKKFGKDTLNILENEPNKLYEVKHLRKKTVEKMIISFQNSKQFSDLIKLLAPFNISTNRAIKIKNCLEKNIDGRKKTQSAVDIIKQNPFILAEKLKGFGFDTLDLMAQQFGCSPTSNSRVRAGIISVLQRAESSGNLCLPQRELVSQAYYLLNAKYNAEIISAKDIAKTICAMAKDYTLLGDNGMAYISDNYFYESKTASIIAELLSAKCEKYETDSILKEVESELHINLSNNQREAVNMAVNHQFSIITGGAGTGKTTVLNSILNVLYKLGYERNDIVLCSPTGKAAQRMKESTKHSASTIHSALNIRVSDEYLDNKEPEIDSLSCKLLVCDEFSMADMYITYRLFSAIDVQKTKVLLIGDTAQLPSVGAGNVLQEFIDSKAIPVTELNVIYRQALENKIVKNSTNIRNGIQKVEFDNKFQMLNEINVELAAELVANLYLKNVFEKGLDSVQVLSPLKKTGELATNQLNKRIQSLLNPPKINKVETKIGNITFREGDKVIQTKNSLIEITREDDSIKTVPLNNGDTGIIKKIEKGEHGYLFTIDFGYGNCIQLNRDEMMDVELAYALTIHKVQGSEYKTIIVPLHVCMGDNMLFRNLLYTGITRAKECVYIVGSENCIHKCIRNNKIEIRNTQLAWRINNKLKTNGG